MNTSTQKISGSHSMKSKLYYQDSYIQTFTTRILKQEKDETGRNYLILDQTAFYPTGGGQPYDTGLIADRTVIDVEEVNGEIRHYVNAPLQENITEVNCTIDWDRRFDHMQQHAGQHILSAAFDHLFGYKTVGFHMGVDNLTIDLETEELTQEEAEKAEELANKMILENRPIEIRWVTEEELSQYDLRKETKVKDNIRLVIIPHFDYNGCGGTHPKATGEVSAVKILDWEKQRKNIRLQFACGRRVLKKLGEKQTVLQQLTKLLNAPEKDMQQAVIRMLENEKQLVKALEKSNERLLHFEATALAAEGQEVLAKAFENRTIQELQKLARMITAENENSLVIFVSTDGNRLQVVCARGKARTENMKKLIGEILPKINGRGGGNESFAQGGGEAILTSDQILDQILSVIQSSIIENQGKEI
ncbi:alanyl-tRNA editing protein [Neobacillus cucumis]|uniref:alanyl-tRNA editing protein n=1 Tax=Neobacillus cucumis TaxID=1740721 RepID=UPI002E1D7596|nr:alanine--tRNA ligase-related protein [Neobacillus cucumis]MED4227671.1 DHHA1 domain-containing protein [Neobacillus cucumis]